MPDDNIANESVTVTLPMNMLAQIDAQVGGDFVDRADFLRAAARHYIEYEQVANRGGQGQVIG